MSNAAMMIRFACDECGKSLVVPASAEGRKGACKACGAQLVVPRHGGEATRDQTSAAPRLPPMRTRRLIADADQMQRVFAHHDSITLGNVIGDPPEIYQIEYRVRGMDKAKGAADPSPRDRHAVEIQLTSQYPRQGPRCKMLTPIFHPNIDSAGIICIGDHWTAGERLVDLVVRIGEMLAYQAYNVKSPLNGQAAMWADLNSHLLPTDNRNLHPAE